MIDEKVGLGRIGLIGRFKPLHLGGYQMLEAACDQAQHVVIGVGSCNKYNTRNPFTAQESEAMINEALLPEHGNYSVIFIPDFGHLPEYRDGSRWRGHVLEQFGDLDGFVSGNDYSRELLKKDYELIYPWDIIPREKWVRVNSTDVRIEMARAGDWQSLVPEPVADYIERNGIVDRFVKEFGLQTLGLLADNSYLRNGRDAEQQHVWGV